GKACLRGKRPLEGDGIDQRSILALPLGTPPPAAGPHQYDAPGVAPGDLAREAEAHRRHRHALGLGVLAGARELEREGFPHVEGQRLVLVGLDTRQGGDTLAPDEGHARLVGKPAARLDDEAVVRARTTTVSRLEDRLAVAAVEHADPDAVWYPVHGEPDVRRDRSRSNLRIQFKDERLVLGDARVALTRRRGL